MDEEKNGGVYKKIRKIWVTKKTISSKLRNLFLKNQFFANFSKQIVFFMSNLHLECFQLSFDIHIVHVGQKLRIFKNCGTES